uniref:CSON013877 protein n=1 Tax=Culicoides sonorensis TaxID=179676 RepID=A0A336KTM7_CULSO
MISSEQSSAEVNIQLDKLPHEYYLPGQQIKCKIMLKVVSTIKIQSISIQYKGRGKSFWTEQNPETLEIREFSGHEQYFSSYQYVFGVQNGREQLIKPGYYVFDSLYRLPSLLPSTITNVFGRIIYSVSVQIQSSSHDIQNKEITRDFKVFSQLDLNDYPDLRFKVENLTSNVYGCQCCCLICCKSRVIDMVTVIPCGAYIPDENIPIFIEIDNRSRLNIETVICEFYELLTFTAMTPSLDSRRETRLLWEHKFNGVSSKENRFFQTILHLDPDFKFNILNGSGIVDAKYFLKTTAIIPSHKPQTSEIEIMIGTKAFNDLENIFPKKIKNGVKSPLNRIIPGSFLIAEPENLKKMTEKDPLLPKNRR